MGTCQVSVQHPLFVVFCSVASFLHHCLRKPDEVCFIRKSYNIPLPCSSGFARKNACMQRCRNVTWMFGHEFDVFVTVSKDQEGHLDLSQMNYQHEAHLAAQHKVFYRYHSQ